MTTVTQLGVANAIAGSTTLVLTVVSNVAVGETIVVFVADAALGEIVGVTDSVGNTYVPGPLSQATVAGEIRPFWCINVVNPLTIAMSFITVTYTLVAAIKLMAAVKVDVTFAVDVQGAGTTATGTAPSIATGALAQATEIVFGFGYVTAGASDTFTESAGFTSNTVASSTSALHSAYQVVSTASSVTYAPTLGTSRKYVFNVISFKLSKTSSANFLMLFRP